MPSLDLTVFGFSPRNPLQPDTAANDNAPLPPTCPPPPPRPVAPEEPTEAPRLWAGPVDLRQGLSGPLPCLSHDDLYWVEATSWGLDSGYVPPPCPASRQASPSDSPPSQAPTRPAVVLSRPPRPFSIFDETAP